jgi:endonuclease/exonuclease/phosphatase family metal-dependent hydrolase
MERLRVVTINIWNKQGDWAARLPLLRKELARLKPDVVGLQEVLHLEGSSEPNQAQELADGFGLYTAFGPAWNLGGGLLFGNALMSRFPIVAAECFQLPGEPGEETRALLYCRLDSPEGAMPVFVTHLDWQLHRGFVRERQVAAIVEKVRELAPTSVTGPSFPPLLMGDFNAEPESDEIRFLRGWTSRLGRSVYFADCFAIAGDGSPGHTYARSNAFAAKAREPNRRIDYLFVRGPDRYGRGEPLGAKLCFTEPDGAIFPSDHYGVFAELAFSSRGA